ncbi:redoxin domain-containing protein [Alkalihalobacillus sp. R86527]|uniref:redoxin domain-containing protein n=1 Tax=Alkalihalobacillus sp. R86527 TaxID=3093863 RepID=UPI00366E3D1D
MKRLIPGMVVVACLAIYAVVSIFIDHPVTKPQKDTSQEVSAQVEEGIQNGNLAPDFSLETLSGDKVKLSDYRGKVVFLNFWATWCPPCKAEMPHMQDFYEENSDQVEIVAVNITSNDSVASVEEFVKQYHLTFPVLLDLEGEQSEKFATITIPTTYIIDKNGIIKQRLVGPMSKDSMEELVSSVK